MIAAETFDIAGLLQTYGPLGVFLGSVLEEIVAPIPSSAVVMLGGFLLNPQDATFTEVLKTNALFVMLPASIGIALGSLFPYWVARVGGEVAINKFGRLLGVDWKLVERAQRYFEGHRSDELLLFIARTIPIIPSVIIGVFCGLIRIPLKEFLLWTFLGSLIRTFALGLIGWGAGSAYATYAEEISGVENLILILAVAVAVTIGIAVWWVRRGRNR